jgi:protein involved in polysaccharide export with SLBB domain
MNPLLTTLSEAGHVRVVRRGLRALGTVVPASVLLWALLPAICGQLIAGQPEFSDLPGLDNVKEPGKAKPAARMPAATSAAPVPARTSTNAISPTVTNSMDALDERHPLSIGDRLSFRIVEDEEDPKQLFVTDLGDLEVPYLGRFPAAGRTCKELARALKGELEKEYYFQATVIVAVDLMAKSMGKVYLVGPVRAPGPQDVPSDENLTLSKAILRAGGFSDFADRKNVRVTRKAPGEKGDGRVFVVNVADVLDKGKSEADLPLEPGDLVYIPERLIRF